ncbi:MAG: DNA mismatch repair protein MutS [Dehalococcoidia bacterium]|nr:DNA mismatch repair protein MutS [Dehalococcoidia bacterium]
MSTPIRRQYLQAKQQHPGCLLLFRLGDFYETFDEDARTISRELGLTLTGRELGKGQRYPMAGIPYHALDGYLAKLIRRGFRVAICEQMSDPATSKGLVDREVVRVVTPGTVLEPNLLEQKANNYLVALAPAGDRWGLAYIDLSTSEFATAELSPQDAALELERLRPAEVLLPEGASPPGATGGAPVTKRDARTFDEEECRALLLRHLGATSLEAYGCEGMAGAVRAAGAILAYVAETQKAALPNLNRLSTVSPQSYMALDSQTRRNLELFQGGRNGGTEHSLYAVLDLTRTPMGGRLMRRWLGQPLRELAPLLKRQEAVAWLHAHAIQRTRVLEMLHTVGDIERLAVRVRAGAASPRDMAALRRSLETAPPVRQALESAPAWLVERLDACPDAVELIAYAIVEDPPALLSDGGVIRQEFSPELDQVRSASRNARDYIASLEKTEREHTGIKSLKVGYNRVFGYYIEVTTPHLALVPATYIRKQTLSGAERYYTPELKEYESLVLNAQERIAEMEAALFRQVCAQVAAMADRILDTADALAHADALSALAEAAARYNYVRPTLTDGDTLDIKAGRHPIVERFLSGGEFVPNDTLLSCKDAQVVVLTGPNMAGKSTFLRQAALIVLMAQMGGFVPAQAATVGLVDRIFTRVGLQDDLATGQSTFMVEMIETAHILHNATSRSLLILDEIGRGTSTYDGMAIARAVIEYIHNHPRLGARTLFATHYHELVEMARYLPRVRNYNVAVAEEGGDVVFLHRIAPGGADKSYGIHVAQLAGLPRPVVHRAREVLAELESADGRAQSDWRRGRSAPRADPSTEGEQMPLFGKTPPWLEELLALDVNGLTPLEALTRLYELQRKAKGEGGQAAH